MSLVSSIYGRPSTIVSASDWEPIETPVASQVVETGDLVARQIGYNIELAGSKVSDELWNSVLARALES